MIYFTALLVLVMYWPKDCDAIWLKGNCRPGGK